MSSVINLQYALELWVMSANNKACYLDIMLASCQIKTKFDRL